MDRALNHRLNIINSRQNVTTIPGRPDLVQQTIPLHNNGMRLSTTAPAGRQNLTTLAQMNNSLELNQVSRAIRNNLIHKDGQDNTALAYDSKIIEFKQYCHAKHNNPPLTELVTIEKAYGFIVYNCYRQKCTTRKKRGDSSVSRFSLSDYQEVCNINCIQISFYNVYTSICCIYKYLLYIQLFVVFRVCIYNLTLYLLLYIHNLLYIKI